MARSIWRYSGGRLRPTSTRVLRKAWASPLVLYDATVYPNDVDLDPNASPRLAVYPHTELDVTFENFGRPIRHAVRVTLTIEGHASTLVRTATLRKTDPSDAEPSEAAFRLSGSAIPRGRTSLTLDLHVPGAVPVHYPMVFTRD